MGITTNDAVMCEASGTGHLGRVNRAVTLDLNVFSAVTRLLCRKANDSSHIGGIGILFLMPNKNPQISWYI